MPNVSLVDGHIDEKQTNYDRIRDMSVEELAEFMQKCGYCSKCLLTSYKGCILTFAIAV